MSDPSFASDNALDKFRLNADRQRVTDAVGVKLDPLAIERRVLG